MQRISVIDYGMGNLRSVSEAVEHVAPADTEVLVTSDQALIADSDKVICPGQGAAKDCMQQLRQHAMDSAVINAVKDGVPFLGICMGLQVLLTRSAENTGTQCLDIIPGDVLPFSRPLSDPTTGDKLKVPHMGWSRVEQSLEHPLWADIESGSRFYFCHSYYVAPAVKELTAGFCDYGQQFTAAVAHNNIFACQFHPEKSATDGLQLLANFSRWSGL